MTLILVLILLSYVNTMMMVRVYYDSSDWKIREEFPFLNRNSCSGLRRAFGFRSFPILVRLRRLLERRGGDGDVGTPLVVGMRTS